MLKYTRQITMKIYTQKNILLTTIPRKVFVMEEKNSDVDDKMLEY